ESAPRRRSARYIANQPGPPARPEETRPMPSPIKGIRKITQEDLDFAAGLLGQGESVDSVRAKLMERNLTSANADAVLEQVHVQAIYGEAAGMLQAGQPPEQVKQAL